MYGVARVVVTARQRDRLSSQQAARWPAKRHVKQPGLQVVETPMMAGATTSGERSARLARANPVVASMAGASVTVPRQGASSAKFRCAAPAQCYCARGETAAVTPAKSRQRRAPDPAMAAPPRQLRSWRSRRAQPRPSYPLSGRRSRQVRN